MQKLKQPPNTVTCSPSLFTHPEVTKHSFPFQAAGRTNCLVRASDEVETNTPPVKKNRKQEANNSDGYSSDTDVDDPDEEMDTDEEQAITLSSAKPNRERGMASTRQREEHEQGQVLSKNKAPNMEDSQELFNASLEAELFPSSATVAQQGANSAVSPVKPNTQSPPQLTRSKAAKPVPSSSLATSQSDYDDDTQMSILNTLF